MMELQEDVFRGEIISRLPLKLVVQCKLLSKKLKNMISDPQTSQILFKTHKQSSTQLLYYINAFGPLRTFYKLSTNPTITCTPSRLPLPYEIDILDSCNGLILFRFERTLRYCVFNPLTGDHQLIPYLQFSTNSYENYGLAVDYPTSDQYKVVTISKQVEDYNLFYKFHLLSSEQSDLWSEIQLRASTSISFSFDGPPVFWRNSLYWLRIDGSILAFDTKRDEAMLIERPQFINHFDQISGKILTGHDIWLGIVQEVLILICIFKKQIVFATYDSSGSSRWKVTHTVDNFVSDPNGIIIGFPVWIDSKQVSFLVKRPQPPNNDLYEYNTQINRYESNAVLGLVDYPMYSFHPTLACIHRTPFINVTTDDQALIAEKLDDIRRFIIQGISIEEESSSEESSSSSSEEEEEEEEEEEDEAGEEGGEAAAGEEIL